MGANSGTLAYGAVDKLIKKYQSNSYKAVSRQNLYYGLEKFLKKGTNQVFSPQLFVIHVNVSS
jgi:hypothetical protein